MKKFLTFTFASCLGVFLAFLVFGFVGVLIVGGAMSSVSKQEVVQVRSNSVLKLNFNQPIPEKTNNVAAQNMSLNPMDIPGVNDIIQTLDHAKTDNKIKGIYLNLTQMSMGKASMDVIRDKISDFKASGKFVIAYSDYYSSASYYMASVADEIIMNPNGLVEFMGFGATIPFFKDGLDKLGVKMQVYYAGQFKSATEPYRLNEMSKQSKNQVRSYLNDLYINYLNDISESRSLSTGRLKTIANNFESRSAQSAVDLGLIDQLGYEDEAISRLKNLAGLDEDDKLTLINLPYYFKGVEIKTNYDVSERIAVVFAEGEIIGGQDSEGQITQGNYVKTIRKITANDKYKALVLRINSPGGNALVADNIWRELKLFKETGRPIVVSMGDYAASGGYYLAAPADKIFANENTLTGSIGVFGMIPNIEGLADKIGVSLDTVNLTKNATSFNLFHPFGETESKFMKENINRTYEQFLGIVAEGRGMSRDEVHKIAQGRVWSGSQAVEVGLVDEIGNLSDAIEEAASLAGIDGYRLSEFPRIKTPVERMMELINGESQNNTVKMKSVLKSELGEYYQFYDQAQSLLQIKPGEPVLRLPYSININ